MSKFNSLTLFVALSLFATGSAEAQQVTNATAVGSDFWTGSLSPDLFQLHANGGTNACSGTEKFVAVRGSLGYCIDADENAAGALEWEDARETCAAAGKRLPEPAEYKFACQAGIAGLNNMTDDYEWATNFVQYFRNPNPTTYVPLIPAITMGNGACTNSSFGAVSSNPASSATIPFRCVH